jgi:SAM-dependent methyltransferase
MLLRDDSDVAWERYGRDDPYYGVLSDSKFRRANLGDDARREFFATGSDQVARLDADVARHFGGYAGRRRALDFGCGVGRCVMPLAGRFEHVIGLDVSRSMLAEAQRNCAASGIANAIFATADDTLSAVAERLDLAHSCLVLQHIARGRGMRILDAMMARLAPGGILAVQFFSNDGSPLWRRAWRQARSNFLPLHWVVNLARGLAWDEPLMQMHLYNLGDVARLAAARGIDEIHCRLETSGSVMLIGRKTGAG